MKQRLKLASAIVHDPKLLILDEPTNGMDPKGRQELIDMARDLAREKGMSLLFSSHLLPDVEAVCDHVMVMGGGKLLASGRLDELKRRPGHEFELRVKDGAELFGDALTRKGIRIEPRDDGLRAELPEGRSVADLWQTAADERLQIRSLKPRRSTLEEVFLSALSAGKEPDADL
jgi:ABC-2 type transport system ATP-binding protein